MNREHNIYKNKITGETLNSTDFLIHVKNEAQLTFEKLTHKSFKNDCTEDYRQQCYLDEYQFQLDNDWFVLS